MTREEILRRLNEMRVELKIITEYSKDLVDDKYAVDVVEKLSEATGDVTVVSQIIELTTK